MACQQTSGHQCLVHTPSWDRLSDWENSNFLFYFSSALLRLSPLSSRATSATISSSRFPSFPLFWVVVVILSNSKPFVASFITFFHSLTLNPTWKLWVNLPTLTMIRMTFWLDDRSYDQIVQHWWGWGWPGSLQRWSQWQGRAHNCRPRQCEPWLRIQRFGSKSWHSNGNVEIPAQWEENPRVEWEHICVTCHLPVEKLTWKAKKMQKLKCQKAHKSLRLLLMGVL